MATEVVTRELSRFEHINLQTAIDTWPARAGRAHLARALDDLLDAAQAVTRTLLGVGVDPASLPSGGALWPGPHRGGWLAHGSRAMPRRFVHCDG